MAERKIIKPRLCNKCGHMILVDSKGLKEQELLLCLAKETKGEEK